jgi:hypothetical protein
MKVVMRPAKPISKNAQAAAFELSKMLFQVCIEIIRDVCAGLKSSIASLSHSLAGRRIVYRFITLRASERTFP